MKADVLQFHFVAGQGNDRLKDLGKIHIRICHEWLPGEGQKTRDDVPASFQFSGHEGEKFFKFTDFLPVQGPLFQGIPHELRKSQQALDRVVDLVNATCHELSQRDHTIFLNEFFEIIL